MNRDATGHYLPIKPQWFILPTASWKAEIVKMSDFSSHVFWTFPRFPTHRYTKMPVRCNAPLTPNAESARHQTGSIAARGRHQETGAPRQSWRKETGKAGRSFTEFATPRMKRVRALSDFPLSAFAPSSSTSSRRSRKARRRTCHTWVVKRKGGSQSNIQNPSFPVLLILLSCQKNAFWIEKSLVSEDRSLLSDLLETCSNQFAVA